MLYFEVLTAVATCNNAKKFGRSPLMFQRNASLPPSGWKSKLSKKLAISGGKLCELLVENLARGEL
jgi:hypothetical protein